MRRLAALLLAVPVLAFAGAEVTGLAALDPSPSITLRKPRLQSFTSCADLLGYVKQKAGPFVTPFGLGDDLAEMPAPVFGPVTIPTPGPPTVVAAPAEAGQTGATGRDGAPDYSTTNVQETGVDEPDIVKSNGSSLFALAGRHVYALSLRSRPPRLLGSLPLDESESSELLLHGQHLLILSRENSQVVFGPQRVRPSIDESVLREVDVSNPSAMRIVRTLEVSGSYLSARLVDGTARVVITSSMPHGLPFKAPEGYDRQAESNAVAHNRGVVASSSVMNWLPSYTLENSGVRTTTTRPLVQCRQVRRPTSFSGLGMLTVLTIDLDRGLEPVDSDGILADGQIVYASPSSLYVATNRWADRPSPEGPAVVGNGVRTAIHKFNTSDPAKTEYRASGEVAGYLLNQWSLSERSGVLRVASTRSPVEWTSVPEEEDQSFVTTLKERDGLLVTLGRVGNIGSSERIFGVRFIGDTGFVVTFRQTDPLFTVDLSDPKRPKVLGRLKLLGYSAYLHPVDDNLLLGLGQDAADDGRLRGTQLSLFDISDRQHPARLARRPVGPSSSEAEYDHHAFLYWPSAHLAVVPVRAYAPARATLGRSSVPFSGAIAFRVGRKSGIEKLGPVPHADTPIRRSLVVGNALFTVSERGVKANSLATLAPLGEVTFPQPS